MVIISICYKAIQFLFCRFLFKSVYLISLHIIVNYFIRFIFSLFFLPKTIFYYFGSYPIDYLYPQNFLYDNIGNNIDNEINNDGRSCIFREQKEKKENVQIQCK